MNELAKKILVFVFGALLLTTGCNKGTEPSGDEITQSSIDNAIIDGEFSTVFSFVSSQGDISAEAAINPKDNKTQNSAVKSDQLPDCATVEFDSTAKTILIDFGAENCLCKDGLYRRGKVMVSFSGVWKSIGSSITVSLVDYYVQDMKTTGSHTISILAANAFNSTIQNASIETPTGIISWNASRTILQARGFLTKNNSLDDEFTISGNASGVNRLGLGFSVVIDQVTPLTKRVNCFLKDFVSGILTITNSNGVELAVNYDPDGSRACNKNAVVTINGKSYAIKLR